MGLQVFSQLHEAGAAMCDSMENVGLGGGTYTCIYMREFHDRGTLLAASHTVVEDTRPVLVRTSEYISPFQEPSVTFRAP